MQLAHSSGVSAGSSSNSLLQKPCKPWTQLVRASKMQQSTATSDLEASHDLVCKDVDVADLHESQTEGLMETQEKTSAGSGGHRRSTKHVLHFN